MPHHHACAKHDRATKRRNLRNRTARSLLRAAIKRVHQAKDKSDAQQALQAAYSTIDKSSKAGIIHRNNAANRKSRLSRMVAKIAS